MFCYPEEFHLKVYPMEKDDIVEVDSFEELKQLDATYTEE